jgi:hypothetical protein
MHSSVLQLCIVFFAFICLVVLTLQLTSVAAELALKNKEFKEFARFQPR